MTGGSSGIKTRNSNGSRIPPVKFNKNGTIEKVNDSIGDTTSSTVISEDNASILSVEKDKGQIPILGGKRSRAYSSPTLGTPKRNGKFQRRSDEFRPAAMGENIETNNMNGEDTRENGRTSTDQNDKIPSSGRIKKLERNFIGEVKKKNENPRFHPTYHMNG